jgi:hypothetical protein
MMHGDKNQYICIEGPYFGEYADELGDEGRAGTPPIEAADSM